MNDNFIPLSVPNLRGNELEYITKAVKAEWVSTGGPYVSEFEENICKYVKAEGAVSVQNGTAGLHISLEVCGISRGDEVIVPTLTFIAAVNPVKYVGAEPIFMDCDESLCLDVKKLLDFCQNECNFINNKLINKITKRQIKAIIIVHVFGNIANMEMIMDIARKYNLIVIEDATEAIGSYYTKGKFKGQYAGTIGNIGVYSFNGNKIITTGGGGMIVSNNKDLIRKAKHLTTQAKSDELYYTHDEIGYNYRMTNIQAALGLAQLEQLEQFIRIKERNFKLYKEKLKAINGLELLDFNKSIRSNYWFYAMYIHQEFNMDRDETITHLSKNNIQTRPLWGLINEQIPYLANQAYKIQEAKYYWKRVVNIPCSTKLTERDICKVIECLKI